MTCMIKCNKLEKTLDKNATVIQDTSMTLWHNIRGYVVPNDISVTLKDESEVHIHIQSEVHI